MNTPTIAAFDQRLTEQCMNFAPMDLELYKAVATHEAAHIVAGLACDAAILEVEINSPRTTKSALGGVNVSGLLPHHDAIICLAGWAWEEAHGDLRGAANDWRAAKDIDPKNLDRNQHAARLFVRDAEPVIKACAAALMKHLNRRGKISRRSLDKVLTFTRPHAQKHARLIGYQEHPRLLHKRPYDRPGCDI